MSEVVIKICILGPSGIGKSCLCKALSDQPFGGSGTVPVRVQEVGRQVGSDHVRVQLWDIAGSQQTQAYWEVLSKSVDGVMLTMDPSHPEQERELEQLYLNFAQPNNLAMKQCMVVGLNVGRSSSAQEWTGLRGKLRKLPMGQVTLDTASPEGGRQAASNVLDRLLLGCVSHKKDKVEKAVLGE